MAYFTGLARAQSEAMKDAYTEALRELADFNLKTLAEARKVMENRRKKD